MEKKSRLRVGRQNLKSQKRLLHSQASPSEVRIGWKCRHTDEDAVIVSTRLGRRAGLLALVLWADRGHGVVRPGMPAGAYPWPLVTAFTFGYGTLNRPPQHGCIGNDEYSTRRSCVYTHFNLRKCLR
jgi:hypothetical protein